MTTAKQQAAAVLVASQGLMACWTWVQSSAA
jgi:hypothetical protein